MTSDFKQNTKRCHSEEVTTKNLL